VLLLDEPASGLDPRARIEIRGLLKQLRGLGKTIMVSSHILPELADICNKVGMLEKGELKVCATVSDIMKQVRQRTLLNIAVVGELDAAAKLLEGHDLVESVEIRDGRLLTTLAEGVEDYSDLPTLLIEAGHKLTLFKEEEINLETAFMALTKGITA
jgi:ABC-2 type transport system ATP-binding protein